MALQKESLSYGSDYFSVQKNDTLALQDVLENYLSSQQLTENTTLIGAEQKDLVFTANIYSFQTSEGILLIDCGSKEGLPGLERNLEQSGHTWSDVIAVLGTHAHVDHVGAGRDIQRRGCSIVMPYGSEQIVTSGDYYLTASYLYEKEFEPFEPDFLVKDGDCFTFGDTQVEVISVPGHTLHDVAYYVTREDDEEYFVGDTLWGQMSEEIQSDLKLWTMSLNKLHERHPKRLLPGHADYHYLPHPERALTRQLPYFAKELQDGFHGLKNPWHIFS